MLAVSIGTIRAECHSLHVERQVQITINRVMDVQGFQTSIKFGAEWNAIAHRTAGTEEVRGEIKKRGLRGAIEWWKE